VLTQSLGRPQQQQTQHQQLQHQLQQQCVHKNMATPAAAAAAAASGQLSEAEWQEAMVLFCQWWREACPQHPPWVLHDVVRPVTFQVGPFVSSSPRNTDRTLQQRACHWESSLSRVGTVHKVSEGMQHAPFLRQQHLLAPSPEAAAGSLCQAFHWCVSLGCINITCCPSSALHVDTTLGSLDCLLVCLASHHTLLCCGVLCLE
jgi:hypothetical protein